MKCKICESEVRNFARATVLHKYNIDYFQCSNCGFVQTEEPYWLKEAYSTPITKSDYGLVARNISFARLTASVIINIFDHKAKFLDYGSGYGLLVRLMRDMGLDFWGYDRYCKSLFADEILSELEEERYELVTAFEVFEHFIDPLQEISRILDFSQNILFSTELLPPSNPKPTEWGYYVPHEGQHISIYTVDSLIEIANKFNLNLYTNRTFIHLLTRKEIPNNLEKLVDFNRYCNVFQETRNTLWQDININCISKEIGERGAPNKPRNQLKIVVDGVFFQRYSTGIARVWRNLLEEWVKTGFAQHILLLDRGGSAPKIPGVNYETIHLHDYGNLEADRVMLQEICDRENADLFISTYYSFPTSTPSVFVAYDMIPEVLGTNFQEPMWQEKHEAIQRASAYISISENTTRDLKRSFPEIESITVAPCGVESRFTPATPEEVQQFKFKYGIGKPYFLLVAPNAGYKNAPLFFQAFAQLPTRLNFELVSTGNRGWFDEAWRNYTKGTVVHTLQLSDEELKLAYAGAIAVVYPSKYEGFGLPVLEALACGCPVITTPNASLPEVAGEAAIYVKDDDVEGMADALCEVQKQTIRQSLIAKGLERAKKFSWTTMAEIVSSALIDATLLPLQLREINFIMFPDWNQAEEELGLELQNVLKKVAMHPERDRISLLIDTTGISTEDANLLLSGVAMNLFMEEDVDVSESAGISLVGQLAPIQWEALRSRLQGRIVLEYENEQAIVQANADSLTTPLLSEDWNSAIRKQQRIKTKPFLSKEYRVGLYNLILPTNHQLDRYQSIWHRYDKALGYIAQVVFQKYPEFSAIDIGANVGDSAALMQQHQKIPILCIEGNPEFIEYLEYNASIIGNIEIEKCFVGNDGEFVNFKQMYSHGGTASIADAIDSEGIPLGEMKSLKRIIQLHPEFQSFKLLKIDTDGFDFFIIKESRSVIAKLKPVLYFEYDITFKSESIKEALETLEILSDCDYRKFIIYDNFGNYLLSLSGTDFEKIIDLNAYLFSNRVKSGTPAVHYLDICAFTQEDTDLFETIRQMEIELPMT